MLEQRAQSAPLSPDRKIEHFSLDDRYTLENGRIVLSGIQALVRLPMDQHRADQRKDIRTGTLIAGYRGSPLGGMDMTLESVPSLLEKFT